MRRDYGKIAFALALIACLGALWLVCASRTTVTEIFVQTHQQNPETSVEVREDGTVCIGGPGKVFNEDLSRLYGDLKLRTRNILHVVFGDTVTEIGYNVFSNNDYVETIYVDKSVQAIGHGAITGCEALQFVYLPAGIPRIGADCMYGCPNAYVVTDGAREDLPELPNVPADHILTGIHSAEDLVAALGGIRGMSFTAEHMTVDDPTAAGDPTRLGPGRTACTPAFSLEPGRYTLRLAGSGLDGLTEGNVRVRADDMSIATQSTVIGEGSVTCELFLEKAFPSLMFQVINGTDADIGIEGFSVYEQGITIPAEVEAWFQ